MFKRARYLYPTLRCWRCCFFFQVSFFCWLWCLVSIFNLQKNTCPLCDLQIFAQAISQWTNVSHLNFYDEPIAAVILEHMRSILQVSWLKRWNWQFWSRDRIILEFTLTETKRSPPKIGHSKIKIQPSIFRGSVSFRELIVWLRSAEGTLGKYLQQLHLLILSNNQLVTMMMMMMMMLLLLLLPLIGSPTIENNGCHICYLGQAMPESAAAKCSCRHWAVSELAVQTTWWLRYVEPPI